jgi:hypothetical protein
MIIKTAGMRKQCLLLKSISGHGGGRSSGHKTSQSILGGYHRFSSGFPYLLAAVMEKTQQVGRSRMNRELPGRKSWYLKLVGFPIRTSPI